MHSKYEMLGAGKTGSRLETTRRECAEEKKHKNAHSQLKEQYEAKKNPKPSKIPKNLRKIQKTPFFFRQKEL